MNDGIQLLRDLADTLADAIEEEAKLVKSLEDENERLKKSRDALKAENERLRTKNDEQWISLRDWWRFAVRVYGRTPDPDHSPIAPRLDSLVEDAKRYGFCDESRVKELIEIERATCKRSLQVQPPHIVITDPVIPWKCGCNKPGCRHCGSDLGDAGKPEPEKPETCVWTELENGRLRGCNGNRFGNELGRSKFCPECGRKVEVRG